MQGNKGCNSGLTASFQYDAVGRRRSTTVGSTVRNFLSYGQTVVHELNGTTPVATLLTGLGIDETLVRTESAVAMTFLTDSLGSEPSPTVQRRHNALARYWLGRKKEYHTHL